MSDVRLILQDNLWFRGKPELWNYRLNGRSMIPVRPKLGLTSSDDPWAKGRELEWLMKYTGAAGRGVVVAQEWIQPRDYLDGNLRGTWLPVFERLAPEGRWCIFYDPFLAAQQRGLLKEKRPRVNFRRARIRDMWERDLAYLQQYFDHPQYWRLRDGHPVLYLWAAFALDNVRSAFRYARARTIYLLADVLGTDHRPGLVHGLTGFTAALPSIARGAYDLRDLLPRYEESYRQLAAAEGYDVIPAGSCQYDDSAFMAARGRGEKPLRIVARHVSDVEAFLELALGYARPIDGTRYLFWGTLNNWAEGTTILPTRRKGRRFPGGRIGHYRFAHLQAIRRAVFGG